MMGHDAHGGEQMKGILLMLASIAVFSFQDVITAYLSRNYPVPFFVMIRYWVFLIFATVMAIHAKGQIRGFWHSQRPFIQMARAVILVLEIAIFALALRYLKLAELHSLFASGPLIVTALSVIFLGETVGWRRWSAVAAGFIGVVIIMRPDAGILQPGALLGVAGALMFALYTIMTRVVSKNDPFTTTYWYTAFFGAICMTLIGPFFWVQPELHDWGYIILLCFTGMSGHLFLIRALEHAPASVLQPLAHIQIFSVSVLGFLFFDEVPDILTIVGALIIISSSIYVVLREHHLARRARRTQQSPGENPDSKPAISEPIIKS